MAIISILDKSAGFYSMFFFTLNHYLFCKKNKQNFKLDSTNWLFKYKYGWLDYFKNVDLKCNDFDKNIYNYKHYQTIENFSLTYYKNIINEVYVYNDKTREEIDNVKVKLDLLNKSYDSIFIRRGDKLIGESNYIHASEYIKLLLLKNPSCNTIFLQTDDYNSYIELKEYITTNNYNINLITLCKEENKGGIIVFNQALNGYKKMIESDSNITNKMYMSKVMDNVNSNKPVNIMTPDEVYKHTIDMIIGVDIVLNSDICICEYSSNVSKFIKLAHKNTNNVYDVLNPDTDIDMNRNECPAFGNLRGELLHGR